MTRADAANTIADTMVVTQGVSKSVAFDPLTILAIIQIIIALVQMVQKCKQPAASINKMGFLTRWRIWGAVKKNVSEKALAKPIFNAFHRHCTGLTQTDLDSLISEQ
jgi:hypothetical protein